MINSMVGRREFLLGLAAGGLLLSLSALGRKAADTKPTASASPAPVEPRFTGTTPEDPHTWVAISPDGTLHVVVARSEMGQGARTTMALAIADELDADRDRLRIVQGLGDEKRYGSQNTDGSTSVRDMLAGARQAGAAAREMLKAAAASQWNVPVTEVKAQHHQIVHEASNRKADIGTLAEAASKLEVPKNPALKERKDFLYLGHDDLVGFDQADMVTGKAVFGADVKLPGMLYAAIMRPPVYGGTLASFDDADAKQVAGYKATFKLPDVKLPAGFTPLGGIAIVATNTWAAIQGRDKVKVTWNDGLNKGYDSDAYRKELEATVTKPAKVVASHGNVQQAQAAAKHVLKGTYYLPHLIHAPMEPPVAVAHFHEGECQVWAPTQNPQGGVDEIAKAPGIAADKVTVHVTLLGGGFGRKSKPDYLVEAALISREVKAPVRVQWTREDEIHHGYYHTVSAQHLEASLDAQDKVSGLLFRTAYPSIGSLSVANVHQGLPFEYGQGFTDLPFDIPNLSLENGVADAHVRIGWFRSVANIYHAYAVQTFLHELAALAGQDHKAFLLSLIGPDRHFDVPGWNYGRKGSEHPIDTARLRHVIEVATNEAGWGRKLPAGHGLGLAVHRSFPSYVATVVEVVVGPDGAVSVPAVHTAIDSGFAVNPDRVRSQIEGAAVMGMSLAMYGAVTFKEGRAQQSNFYDFQMARMNTSPLAVHTHIINTSDALGGVGEPGLPVFAPALANAITAATGKRFKSLPLAPQLARA